jgi:hypothetical protein
MERFGQLNQSHATHAGQIKGLHESQGEAWDAIDKMRDMIGNVRVQVAAIVALGGCAQAVLTGFIVYKITRGG